MGDYTYFGTEIYEQTNKIIDEIGDQLNDNKEEHQEEDLEDLKEEYPSANVYDDQPILINNDESSIDAKFEKISELIQSSINTLKDFMESSGTENSTEPVLHLLGRITIFVESYTKQLKEQMEQVEGTNLYFELQGLFNDFNKSVVHGVCVSTRTDQQFTITMNIECQKICRRIYKLLSNSTETFYLLGFDITKELNVDKHCLHILPPFKIFNQTDIESICNNNTELLLLETDDAIKQEYNNLVWMDKFLPVRGANVNKNIDKKYILPTNKIEQNQKTGYGILKKIYKKMNLIDPTMYKLCIGHCLAERLY